MYISLNLDLTETQQLQEKIEQEVPKAINELLFKDKTILNNMIQKCVKRIMENEINNLMQGRDFREYLRDKICMQIGVKND